MLKRKNKKALPEQLEDSLYPDDYWLDKEDGQEVSEPLPDGENPVSGKLRKEPMVTGYEALERQRGVRRPKRKITRREKKALKQAQKYEAKLRKEQEEYDENIEKDKASRSMQPKYTNEKGESLLMQCRHCIRYSLGYCVKRGGKKPTWREPLFLQLGDGRRFRLEFACNECQMNLYSEK